MHQVGSQGDLFAAIQEAGTERRDRLLATVDTVNRDMRRGTLRFAAEGIGQPWRMKRERVTPDYTTSWSQLPLVG